MINLISKGSYKIAWRNGCPINKEFLQTAKALSKNSYGQYLADLMESES